MRIILNGDTCDIEAETLESALSTLGYSGAAVATAVNGSFIPSGARKTVVLAEGDEIEVLAPMRGG